MPTSLESLERKMLKAAENKELEFLCIEMKSSWTTVEEEEERLYHFRLAKAILASFAFSCLCFSFFLMLLLLSPSLSTLSSSDHGKADYAEPKCVLWNGNANANIFVRSDVTPTDVRAKRKETVANEWMWTRSLSRIHTHTRTQNTLTMK